MHILFIDINQAVDRKYANATPEKLKLPKKILFVAMTPEHIMCSKWK